MSPDLLFMTHVVLLLTERPGRSLPWHWSVSRILTHHLIVMNLLLFAGWRCFVPQIDFLIREGPFKSILPLTESRLARSFLSSLTVSLLLPHKSDFTNLTSICSSTLHLTILLKSFLPSSCAALHWRRLGSLTCVLFRCNPSHQMLLPLSKFLIPILIIGNQGIATWMRILVIWRRSLTHSSTLTSSKSGFYGKIVFIVLVLGGWRKSVTIFMFIMESRLDKWSRFWLVLVQIGKFGFQVTNFVLKLTNVR